MRLQVTDRLLLLLRSFWALLGRQSSSDLGPSGPQGSASTSSETIQSSSSSQRVCKYDVFLSFRGIDTRKTFVNHLYNHLIRKGIFVFKDDKQLWKGKSISSQLVQAIRDSKVSIVVFSKDYAASSWCLDEMAAISQCHRELDQIVFPVFYDVDPSHVRKQDGHYKNLFDVHSKKFNRDSERVNRWKSIMTDLAGSAGWDVRDKPEFEEIENIVQAVIQALGHKFSGLADDLIGIQPHVEALEKELQLSSKNDDVRVLGIWGMGGIGKTTHATVLYDRISYQFDTCCFVENLSKIYKDGGASAVQKQILRQALDEKNLDAYSPSEISGIIRNRLHNTKVLLVIDNVDQLEQLQELAIDPKFLLRGSRMIITTRDEHILKVYGAHVLYEVPLLTNDDACKLFYKKAFKSEDPTSKHVKMIPEVLKYAQHLPLSIRVVGSFLCTRDATQWRDALDRLRNNPDNKIMNVLQISVDGLQHEEKEIFLHIACFFKGQKEEYVKQILDACGLHPHIGIPVITEKSLITLRNQEIHMHEMLQELGKQIVRQQFPKDPGSWSRLWLFQDFVDVMMTRTGTNQVKAIVLDQKKDVSKYPQLRAEGLSTMTGLIILILHHQNFLGSLKFLSSSLHYLQWHGYPFSSLPLNFEPYHLVELNMPNSSIEQLWEGRKDLPCLKRVDLSNSKYLIETPNFQGCRSLERLDFTGCTNLSQVHPSIGLLENLAFLSLEGCSSLVSLDLGTEFNLYSLRVLHLSGCTKLEGTPDFTGASNLEYLDIDQCMSLSIVDHSIGNLTKLKFLSLRDCTNLVSIPESINSMTSLLTFDLCGCLKLKSLPMQRKMSVPADNIYLDDELMSYEYLIFLDLGFCNLGVVPDAIGHLLHLERLNLEGNNFVLLPYMRRLSRIAYLNLANCSKLRYWPELPRHDAPTSQGGMYFKTVSGSHNHRSGLYILNCPLLEPSEESEHLVFLWLNRLVKNSCHFRCGLDIVVPGNTIPEWFNHKFMGCRRARIGNLPLFDQLGVAFCVAFKEIHRPTIFHSSHSSFSSHMPHPFYLSFESEQMEESFDMPLRLDLNKVDGSNSGHLWLIYISRPHCHFMTTGAHITFKAHPGLEIKEWGLRVVFEQTVFDPQNMWTTDLEGMQVGCVSFDHGDESSSSSVPKIQLPYNWLLTEDAHGSSSNTGPKFQLPYNWFMTEDEENENMQVNAKQNYLSNMGRSMGQSL